MTIYSGIRYVKFVSINNKETWVCGWIQGTILMIVSTRITNRLRIKYFQSILRQDVGYFDLNSVAEMNMRLFDDIKRVSDGVGDKLGVAVQVRVLNFTIFTNFLLNEI